MSPGESTCSVGEYRVKLIKASWKVNSNWNTRKEWLQNDEKNEEPTFLKEIKELSLSNNRDEWARNTGNGWIAEKEQCFNKWTYIEPEYI